MSTTGFKNVNRWRASGLTTLVSLLLVACGGGGGDNGTEVTDRTSATICDGAPADVTPDVVVSAATGDDEAGAGTCLVPYKTITKALSVAQPTQVIWVAPGTYDSTLGESFPLHIPGSVSLIGDEQNTGEGATATRIVGGGSVIPGATLIGAAVMPGADSVLAGFFIKNDFTGNSHAMGVYVNQNGVTLRHNSVKDNPKTGVYVTSSSANHVIDGNVITGNSAGIVFANTAGAGTVVQNNTVTNNNYGIEMDTLGADIGGGAAGSLGKNLLSCNTTYDFWNSGGGGVAVYAENNIWDHVPPTEDTTRSVSADIYLGTASLVTVTNGTLATAGCP